MNHIERLHAAIANPKALKRDQWEEIKQRSPDLASFLQLVNKTFGKPKSVNVTWKSQPLIGEKQS